MPSQAEPSLHHEPAGEVTRYLWYEVKELPGPALCVRRTVAPGGSCFMWVWMVGWFGGLLLLSCLSIPRWFLFILALMGVGSFWASFDTLGLGEEGWHVEEDLLVVRRRLFGWSGERRYTGTALQLSEEQGAEAHVLAFSVHGKSWGHYLFHTNHPSPEELAEAAELAQRLAQITGWRLVTLPR